MNRPRTVYRGRPKLNWLVTVLLSVLALIVAGAVWMFEYMQRYVVYEKDGLSIVLPYMREGDADPFAPREDTGLHDFERPQVDAEIVVDEADFDDISIVVGEDLTQLRARYVPAAAVAPAQLIYLAGGLESDGYNAMVIQLKTSDGQLSYYSGVGLTNSYGVNGTENIREAVAEIKEQEVYLVAELGTLMDDAMALRNTPLALKDSRGLVITDSGASWLDPYNRSARQYITDIMVELAGMGFDEVLLTGIAHPRTEDIVYSQEMTSSPGIASSVSTFALRMCETAHDLGMKCSVLCQTAELRLGTGSEIGQSPELLFSLFDRVYVFTDQGYFTTDMGALTGSAGPDQEDRIVPITVGWTPNRSSYAVQ